MISKMKRPEEGGSRVAIVFNGSPLFTGAAGSGESEIRRWIIENDWLEAVVALPDQLFYNTGISTYFWVVTNRKAPERRGKVQLVDAREYFVKMRKSLGEKRKQISDDADRRDHAAVRRFRRGREGQDLPQRGLRLPADHGRAAAAAALGGDRRDDLDCVCGQGDPEAAGGRRRRRSGNCSRSTRGASFATQTGAGRDVRGRGSAVLGLPGSRTEGPLVSAGGPRRGRPVITDRKGNPEPDPELRDNENVPLPSVPVSFDEDPTERFATLAYRTAVDDYMRDEVLPYVSDAWVDHDKTKIGYEIPLTRHFYKYVPPRPLEEIDAEIKALEEEIQRLFGEVAG